MSPFDVVKTLHIVSAAIIFGTGLGTAFLVWRADRGGEVAAIAFATRHAVLADWLFTTPAVIFQPLSGAWLIWQGGYGPGEAWLLWTYGLYLLAAVCWLPVVRLQLRLRDLAREAAASGAALPPAYRRIMGAWVRLGWPAFLAILAIFYLMVAKP
jgi:uncharacterized membrane protein